MEHAQESSYKQALLDTNPESWLSLLDGLTMRSVCVEIPPKVAITSWSTDDAFLSRLDDAIGKVGGCAFVRTSLRSPKDSTHAIALQKRFVKESLPADGKASDNLKMVLLLQSALRGMKVKSASEAVALLSTSSRVAEDLERFRAECPNVVVREFRDIDVSLEFRTFVVGGKCTAISQYYSTLFFEDLASKKDWLEPLIVEFVERTVCAGRLSGRKEFESVILDVLVDGNTRQCTVIELNPWGEATHAW